MIKGKKGLVLRILVEFLTATNVCVLRLVTMSLLMPEKVGEYFWVLGSQRVLG